MKIYIKSMGKIDRYLHASNLKYSKKRFDLFYNELYHYENTIDIIKCDFLKIE